MAKEMYSASCKESGLACDFQVCDSSEDEVINAVQDHARRAHGKDLKTEDIRPMIKSGAMASCH